VWTGRRRSAWGPRAERHFGTTRLGARAETAFGSSRQLGGYAIYGFEGDPQSSPPNYDGESPQAGLVDYKSVLYGTTIQGGTNFTGTVFSITTGGSENVLHSFTGSPDGQSPNGSLIEVDGKLYGTTESGGSANEGCVFSITSSGSESVLYSFQNGTDGNDPMGRLLYHDGALYATTEGGGSLAGNPFSNAPSVLRLRAGACPEPTKGPCAQEDKSSAARAECRRGCDSERSLVLCHPERGAKRRSRRTTAVIERADRPSTSRLRRFAQDDNKRIGDAR
jgi:uncharacterized repeat protein (TIGR03803 family)